MKKRTTRLHFSEKDLENAAVSRAAKKAERAADRQMRRKPVFPPKASLRDEKGKDRLLWRTASFWKEGFFGCGGRDCFTWQASKPLCSPCGYRNAQCAGAS